MQKHICKRRKCTLPVNAVMIHKTLVLNSNKGVYKVLRYAVVGNIARFCFILIIINPNAVKLTVQALILGIIAVTVVRIYRSGKIKL